jgi:argininosuccinate lyase
LADKRDFPITTSQEDCHTAIEEYLTAKYGETGKKIHTGRSRNDQVLTAVRLFEKEQVFETIQSVNKFIAVLEDFEIKFGAIPMAGFTHTRKGMPSSVSLWTKIWIASMNDNLILLDATNKLIDQSPLGSAAGYGLPQILNISRETTAKAMGFAKPQETLYCQHSRGKFESTILHTLSQIMFDLNRLASDLILFSEETFGLFILPKEFCTGSSIMPQKYNPDCLELMRGKYHQITALEFQLKTMSSNLISGYHREFQLTKEPILKGFEITFASLAVITEVFKNLSVDENRAKAMMTPELFATEEAYKLVLGGMSFREAYKIIGAKFSK